MEHSVASHAMVSAEVSAVAVVLGETKAQSNDIGAVTRTVEHVDPMRWGFLLFTASYVRWALWHPFRLAMVRQRSDREQRSAAALLLEALRRDGVRGVFRGVGVAAFGNAFGETAYIAIFETARHERGPLGLIGVSSPTLRDSVAGTCADVLNVLLAAPFDVVSSKQMAAGCGLAASAVYANSWTTARDVHRARGLRGFFAGTVPSLMYSPSSAMWWAMYEPMKGKLYAAHSNAVSASIQRGWSVPAWVAESDDNAALNATAGVVSSVVCTGLYNPVLVVATRMQIGLGWSGGKRQVFKGSTVLWIVRDLWINEGARGLTKGLRVNLGMAVAEGLLFSQMYEVTKMLAQRPTQ